MAWSSFRAAFLMLAAAVPARADVVSLNLCTDQLLMLLAPERITALSPLAQDPSLSTVAAEAHRFPWVRPDAEAVLLLHPTLVLAGAYGPELTLAALRTAGIKVVQVSEPTSFAEIATEIGTIAAALDVPDRGLDLISRMQADLRAVHRTPHGTALLWQPRGYTAGPGSFGAEVLARAGYRNAGTGRVMPVEAVLIHPPDLLVTETEERYPSLATDLLLHPALAGLHRRQVSPASLACPGPWSVAAVQALSR